MDPIATHESFERDETAKGSSDRGFGIVFAIFFAIVGLWPLVGGGGVRLWSLGAGCVILVVAFSVPGILAPFNRVWMLFGLLLHRITNPVIMGLIFYLVVTPIALGMRALGKDPLRRHIDQDARSYWIERKPPGPEPETMKQQF